MKRKTMKRDEDQYLSWKEFKQLYLSKVKRLAEILGLNREEMVNNYEDPFSEQFMSQREIDDDYKFVNGVMNCIAECEDKKISRISCLNWKKLMVPRTFSMKYIAFGCLKHSSTVNLISEKCPDTAGGALNPEKER